MILNEFVKLEINYSARIRIGSRRMGGSVTIIVFSILSPFLKIVSGDAPSWFTKICPAPQAASSVAGVYLNSVQNTSLTVLSRHRIFTLTWEVSKIKMCSTSASNLYFEKKCFLWWILGTVFVVEYSGICRYLPSCTTYRQS